MTPEKQAKALKLFQEQIDKFNIAPIRNKHNYDLMSHNQQEQMNINIDYENYTVLQK